MKISLTSIFVDDPLTAFRFYTEILGFVEHLFLPEARLAIVASAEEPQGTALLLEPNDNPIASTYQAALFAADLPVIVFGTDDIYAEYGRLQALDVNFRYPPTRSDAGTETLFEDSCGNLVQLYQL